MIGLLYIKARIISRETIRVPQLTPTDNAHMSNVKVAHETFRKSSRHRLIKFKGLSNSINIDRTEPYKIVIVGGPIDRWLNRIDSFVAYVNGASSAIALCNDSWKGTGEESQECKGRIGSTTTQQHSSAWMGWFTYTRTREVTIMKFMVHDQNQDLFIVGLHWLL